MIKHFIATILIMFVSIACFCQVNLLVLKKIGHVENLPMRNAEVLKVKNPEAAEFTPSTPSVAILSNCDSVFSVCSGIVSFVFDRDAISVMIEDKQGKVYDYASLNKSFVLRGDTVLKGSFIGLVKPFESNTKYHLSLTVTDANNNSLTEDKIWKMIKDQ
jgi:Peptidase family M23